MFLDPDHTAIGSMSEVWLSLSDAASNTWLEVI